MNSPPPGRPAAAPIFRAAAAVSPSPRGRLSARRGFSLLEVIAALLLSGILIALLLPLVGTGLQSNVRPAGNLQDTYALRSVMDEWVHRSRTDFEGDLPGLSAAVTAGAAGGGYLVLYNEWITFDINGQEVETPGNTDNFLRITLGNAQGNSLTFIFTP